MAGGIPDLDFNNNAETALGVPDLTFDKEDAKSKYFENLPAVARGALGGAGAIETMGRGGLGFVAGTAGKVAGTVKGALETGTVAGAVKKGQEFEQAASSPFSPSVNPASAYMDKQMGHLLEWARNKSGEMGEAVSDTPAGRSLGEGAFDVIMALPIAMIPKSLHKAAVQYKADKIALREAEEKQRAQAEADKIKPTTQMGQQDLPMGQEQVTNPAARSPYNLPPEEIERLNKELNPDVEQRVNNQAELFTTEQEGNPQSQIPKWNMEQGEGGRNAPLNMDNPVTSAMNTDRTNLGGAIEQSGMPSDLFAKPAEMNRSPISGLDIPPELAGQAAALTKPGFARSAEEVMRARELDHQLTSDLLDRKEPPQRPTLDQGLAPEEGLNRPRPINKGKFGQGGAVDPSLLSFGLAGAFRRIFKRSVFEEALNQHPNSRETLVYMNPKDFLNLAMKVGDSDLAKKVTGDKKANVDRVTSAKTPLDGLPTLTIEDIGNGEHQVTGHNGRHRAMVFDDSGYPKMPVKIISNQGRLPAVRWGSADPAEFPKTLRGERTYFTPNSKIDNSHNTIEFPEIQTYPKGNKTAEFWQQEHSKSMETRDTQGMDFAQSKLGQLRVAGGQRGSIGWASDKAAERLKEAGPVGANREIAEQFNLEKSRVPLAKIVGEISKGALQDISDAGHTFAKVLTDKTISILAEGKKGAGEVIKWVTDNEKMIDMQRELNIEAAKKGEGFVKGKDVLGRGFEKRLWDESGALTSLRNLARKDMKQAVEMKEEWLKAMMEKRDPTFKTPEQRKTFEAVQVQLEKTLKDHNAERAKAGIDPIQPIKNYFPALWMGDYRFSVKTKDGQTIGYYARGSAAPKLARALKLDVALEKMGHPAWELNGIQRELKKQFPEYDVGEIYHVEQGKYDLDTGAFEQALRIFGADDPAAQALQHAYAEIVGHKGFAGKRSLKKDNVLGFMGSEAGDYGVRNMDKALDTYITRMYTATANLQKRQLLKQIAEMPLEVRQKLPNTVSLMNDYLQHSAGGNLSNMFKGLDVFAETVSDNLGFGKSGATQGTQAAKSIMGLYWLGNAKFIASQVFQMFNSGAKLVDLVGGKDALAATWKGIEHSIFPDASATEGVNWARRRGYLDSVLVEMISASEIGRNSISERAAKITGWTLGKVEQEVVRIPSFLMFEHALRDAVPDSRMRYERAAELMDHYMVNYRQAASPMVYNHFGEQLGGTAKSLKQYSHNSFGQFFEYLSKLNPKDLKSAAPLATFMGTTALLAGIKGTILVAEAAVIIHLLNQVLEVAGVDPIPTIDEWMMDKGVSDLPIFGLSSYLTGQDMSASIGAPGLPAMFSLPLQEFSGTIMKDVGNYALKGIFGVDNSADRMKAALAVSPNLLKATIEKIFTEDSWTPLSSTAGGKTVPDPNHQMQGNWIRDDKTSFMGIMPEWWWDQAFGGRSMNESRANSIARFAREDLRINKESRGTAISAITDKIVAKEPVSPELMKRYVMEGGDGHRLKDAIVKEMQRRQFTYMEDQQMVKKGSAAKARDLQILQDKIKNNPNPRTPSSNNGVPDLDFKKDEGGVGNISSDGGSTTRTWRNITGTEDKMSLPANSRDNMEWDDARIKQQRELGHRSPSWKRYNNRVGGIRG